MNYIIYILSKFNQLTNNSSEDKGNIDESQDIWIQKNASNFCKVTQFSPSIAITEAKITLLMTVVREEIATCKKMS